MAKLPHHLAVFLLAVIVHYLFIFSLGFLAQTKGRGQEGLTVQAIILSGQSERVGSHNFLSLDSTSLPDNSRMPVGSEASVTLLPLQTNLVLVSHTNDSVPLPILLPAADYYFKSSELTSKPSVQSDTVTELLLNVPIDGERIAILNLFINENGNVDNVEIDHSLLPEDAKDELLIAFAKLRFNPGEINGDPVKSLLSIQIDLEEGLEVRSNLH